MTNRAENKKAQTLTRLLKRIDCGDNPELLRKEAHRLLPNVGPEDIATAEQSLIDDGYSAQVVQLLSAMFMLMGIPEEQGSHPRAWLPANHVLRVVMIEHDLLRSFLADLEDVVGTIRQMAYVADVSSEFRKLGHIAEHLNAMKRHIDREDDVIFPSLKNHGRISLCQALEGDHITIRTGIDNLLGLLVLFNEVNLDQFKSGLVATTRRLGTTIKEHLCHEDEILFPVALGIINDAKFWEQMKAVCDEFGYCGVHT
ncbi:MAG TPA: DUF438 domain-containing protein [Sedimentisphaerales bacterium]|nr:DUF438 domain-containing protein [Sedimentisphaerales bacterium]